MAKTWHRRIESALLKPMPVSSAPKMRESTANTEPNDYRAASWSVMIAEDKMVIGK